MRLFILGLRRSGTTAFWRAFREDPRMVAYNEPFNPLLRHVSDPSWLDRFEAYREFHDLWKRDPATFWQRYRAIHGLEEIQEGLSDQQGAYLEFLLSSADHTVFDFTRAHFKVASLAEQAPEAVLVHLHRDPGSFATSHLVPSGQQIPRRGSRTRMWGRLLHNAAVKRLNRATFFRRSNRYNYWGIEDIVGSSPDSLFGTRLVESGLDPLAVYRLPALGRLLAFWRIHYERLERDGRRFFGERFVSVRFEDYCERPLEIVTRIYDTMKANPPPGLSLSHVHPARGRYRPSHPEWERCASLLALPRV